MQPLVLLARPQVGALAERLLTGVLTCEPLHEMLLARFAADLPSIPHHGEPLVLLARPQVGALAERLLTGVLTCEPLHEMLLARFAADLPSIPHHGAPCTGCDGAQLCSRVHPSSARRAG